MCGIFTLLNSNYENDNKQMEEDLVLTQFMKGKNRGPEFSILEPKYLQMILGFHRLAFRMCFCS